jgi:hypothetical protein
MSTRPAWGQPGRIRFSSSHTTAVPAGDYTLSVVHDIRIDGVRAASDTSRRERTFTIVAEQFSLGAEQVVHTYPPAHARGLFDDVLPHVVLKRPMLPWERGDTPWLALVVFSDDETGTTVQEKTVPFQHLAGADPYHPPVASDSGHQPDDLISVVDLPASLADEILPTADDLSLLCHTRREASWLCDHGDVSTLTALTSALDAAVSGTPLDDADRQALLGDLPALSAHHRVTSLGVQEWLVEDLRDVRRFEIGVHDGHLVTWHEQDEHAVVVANRLPKSGSGATVHLVSVANRYGPAGIETRGARDLRLVSLYRWDFRCERDPADDLPAVLARIDLSPLALEATRSDPQVDALLGAGFVPLEHQLRTGSRTVSWYRGPLVPGKPGPRVGNPVATVGAAGRSTMARAVGADELLAYDATLGMLDASLAAAWTLGRLSALDNAGFATALFDWKQALAQRAWRQHQSGTQAALPLLGGGSDDAPPVPAVVQEALRNWAQFSGISFDYLVPDDRLLPMESLRMFSVDRDWVEAFVRGACSLGRAASPDHAIERVVETEVDSLWALLQPSIPTSGVLLRSAVVDKVSDLRMFGYATTPTDLDDPPTPPVRTSRLGASALLALFDIDLAALDLHRTPQTMHVGVHLERDSAGALVVDSAGDPTGYVKNLRLLRGESTPRRAPATGSYPITRRALRDLRTTVLAGLSTALGRPIDDSAFPMEMIDAPPLIRFVRGTP